MNNSENRNLLECPIVRDLLPLYHDEVVSDETKTAVDSHLEDCEGCRNEYASLCAGLPVEADNSASSAKFAGMMRQQKTKRIIAVISAAIGACLLLVGCYFAQLTLAVTEVPNEEISEAQVYRYESNGEDRFFVMCAYPLYDGVTHVAYKENGNTLEISIKKPLVCASYDLTDLCGPIIIPVSDGITAVRLGGKVVWSEEINGEDAPPPYVYAYDQFENKSGDISSWGVSFDVDNSNQNWLSAEKEDGTVIYWDFEGNELTVFVDEGE